MLRFYQLFTVYIVSLLSTTLAYADDVVALNQSRSNLDYPLNKSSDINQPEPETEFDITQDLQRKTESNTLRHGATELPLTTNQNTSTELNLSLSELAQQPELLYRALSSSVLLKNIEAVRMLLPIYQQQEIPKDELLIDLAQAMIERDNGYAGKAAKHYQKILDQHPNMDLVKLNLAQSLFDDHQNREADKLFEQIQAQKSLPENVFDLTNSYRKILKKRNRVSAYAGANYTRDNNINNSPKVRTIKTKNGAWHLPEPEFAQGIAYRAGLSKDTALFKNYSFRTDADLLGKFYWDNHKYDDLSLRTSVGLAFQNNRSELAVMPYYERRWFGTEKYATEKGIRVEASHWLMPKHQILAATEVGRDTYDKRQFLNGRVSNLSLTWLSISNAQQYFTLGTDLSRKSAEDTSESYRRKGIRASWSRHWDKSGLNTLLSASYGQREYDARDFFNIVRKDKESSASLSVWHDKIKLWGITPRIVGVYSRNSSNHFMYDYHKAYAFMQLSKSI